MKVLIRIILLSIIATLLVNLVYASVFANMMKVYYDTKEAVFQPIKIEIEGEPFISDAPITPINGISYAPMKAVFERMGATVRWYGNEDKVSIEKGEIFIELTINSNIAVVNGKKIFMNAETKVMRYEGLSGYYTMVPARFIAEQLGMIVGYESNTRTMTFNTPNEFKTISKVNYINNSDIEKVFIKIDDYSDYSMFIIEPSSENKYKRIVFDFRYTNIYEMGKIIGTNRVNEIRFSQNSEKTSRVTIEVNPKVNHQIIEEDGYLAIYLTSAPTPTPTSITTPTPTPITAPTPTPISTPTPTPITLIENEDITNGEYKIPVGIIKYAKSEKLAVVTIDNIEFTNEELEIGMYKEKFTRGVGLEISFSSDLANIPVGTMKINDKFFKNIIVKNNKENNTQSILIEFNCDLSYGILSKTGDGKTKYYFNETIAESSRKGTSEPNNVIFYNLMMEYEEVEIKVNNITDYVFLGTEEKNKKVISFKNTGSILNPEEFFIDSKRVISLKYARHDEENIWFVIEFRDNVEIEVIKNNNRYSIRFSDILDTDTGIEIVEDEKNIINSNDFNKFNNIIGKNLFYSNINDRVYFRIEGATLTEGSEDLIKYYTGVYENNSKTYTIEFNSNLAEVDEGKIIINDIYLDSIEIIKNSITGKSKIIFTAKDIFIYCVFTRYNTNADNILTAITLLKPVKNDEKLVVIDPGHGGGDPGKPIGKIYEKDINLAIALKLKEKLQDKNINVYILREDDTFIGLYERTYIANYLNSSFFISIHNNASSRETINGTETYYFPSTVTNSKLTGQKLAELVQSNLLELLGSLNRKVISNTSFAVLKSTMMPAILTEVGFMTNPEELRKLISEDYQMKIAEAISIGIEKAIISMD